LCGGHDAGGRGADRIAVNDIAMGVESIIRLVLTGPESTGKSALTEHLGRYLGAPYVLEYARAYLEAHGPQYNYDLLKRIHRGHRLYQRIGVAPKEPIGVFDTDSINYLIWCEVAYGRCHNEIRAAVEAEITHRYLLCYPDLPWEPDPLREHPHARMMLFDLHLREIERLRRPYIVIRGIGPARYRAAEEAARRLLAP
jgi:nicotinamide riboside kinase